MAARHYPAVLSLSLLGLGAGCLDPVEILDAPDARVQDPSEDRDGDGLSNDEETGGWTIFVDTEAFGPDADTDKLSARMVTSDPDDADTDGDGIDDADEFFDRTDPRRADTDGDRLDDFAEKYRWKTNAKSVDSDGDARGGDASQFPHAQLYDGAELENGTSPSLADTDGDGRDDYQETITDPEYDPRIAELPRAEVSFAGPVDMRLFVEYEDRVGSSSEYGSAFEQEAGTSQSRSDMRSTTTAVKGQSDYFDGLDFAKQGAISFVGQEVLNFGVGFLPDSIASALDVNKEPTPDVASTESSIFTAASSVTSRSEYARYVTESQSRTERGARGEIHLGVTVTNAGRSSFELERLFTTVLQWQPLTQDWKALATLQPAIDSSVVIAAGQQASFQVQADNINPALLKEFLSNPSRLYYDTVQYAMRDADGIDFAFIADNAYARTALVTIDYGNGNVEHHRVATHVDRYEHPTPNPDDPDKPFALGDPAGISMKDFLEIAGVDYGLTARDLTGTKRVQVLTRVGEVENLKDEEGSPFPGPRVEGVVHEPTAFWVVHTERGSQAAEDLDFEELRLRGGDSVRLVYVKDLDGDGLFQREETVLGSNDADPATGLAVDDKKPADQNAGETTATVSYQPQDVALTQGRIVLEDGRDGVFDTVDSDSDGLTDHEEARVGWTVAVEGRDPFTVYSSVNSIDTDGDSLTDLQERIAGTDPLHVDTDRDGLPDGCERAPTAPGDRHYETRGWVALGGTEAAQCRIDGFVYIYTPGGDLSGYQASLTTGVFAPIAGSPFLSRSTQFAADILVPTGRLSHFAYATENSYRIWGFAIDPETGALDRGAVQQVGEATNEVNQNYTRLFGNPRVPAVYAHNPTSEYVQFTIGAEPADANYGALALESRFSAPSQTGLALAPDLPLAYQFFPSSAGPVFLVFEVDERGVVGRSASSTIEASGEQELLDLATAPATNALGEAAHLIVATSPTQLRVWQFSGSAESPDAQSYGSGPLPAGGGRTPLLTISPDGRHAYVDNGVLRAFRLDEATSSDATLTPL